MKVTLDLTADETRALLGLAGVYLATDGPAYECMPEWEDAHDPETLTSLRGKVIDALVVTE